MMVSKPAGRLRFQMTLGLALLLMACGGGGSPPSTSTSPPPPPPPHPIQTLSSLDRIVSMQNSGGFTLSVNGTGFTSDSQVLFNGAPRTTTFVKSTQLTAQISASDLAGPGTFPVTVDTDAQSSGPLDFFVVPAIAPRTLTVAASQPATANIDVGSLTPSLSFIAAGTCFPRCRAGSTGTQVKRGDATVLFLVGKGLVPGTFFMVTGSPPDVAVTQPLAGDFAETTTGLPAAKVSISLSPSAALGPRNILATNVAGEISVFPGGLLITGP